MNTEPFYGQRAFPHRYYLHDRRESLPTSERELVAHTINAMERATFIIGQHSQYGVDVSMLEIPTTQNFLPTYEVVGSDDAALRLDNLWHKYMSYVSTDIHKGNPAFPRSRYEAFSYRDRASKNPLLIFRESLFAESIWDIGQKTKGTATAAAINRMLWDFNNVTAKILMDNANRQGVYLTRLNRKNVHLRSGAYNNFEDLVLIDESFYYVFEVRKFN